METSIQSALAFEQDSKQAPLNQHQAAAKFTAPAKALEEESSDAESLAPLDPPV